jgi:DNA-binding Lrp family transcriptional regulator
MAQSPEHVFLSESLLAVLQAFTATDLYGYREANRSRFDFACDLLRDWERGLVGQTLWAHSKGLDKDIRTLLTEQHAAIRVYVARDDMVHRKALHEALADYRGTPLAESLGSLRVLWITPDFDAEDEADRNLAFENLRDQVVEDLLFNVVFEKLVRSDVQAVANDSGRVGLLIALMGLVARASNLNYRAMADSLGVSTGPVRERLQLLLGLGLVSTPPMGLDPTLSPKGKVLLDLLAAVHRVGNGGAITPEFDVVLRRLDASPIMPVGEPIIGMTVFERLFAACEGAVGLGFDPEASRVYGAT